MHIEPGVVEGAKIVLSYGTAGAAGAAGAKLVVDELRRDGVAPMIGRAVVATAAVFTFFQVFPHVAVGASEVHLIFGTSLLLLFGPGSAAIGLATGLLLQGLLFAPTDLPQYAMNVTTLLVPLFAMSLVGGRIIDRRTAYVDLAYHQVLRLSATYQAGVVAWVGFWVVYGEGLTAAAVRDVAVFGLAYLAVIAIEPIVDLAILKGAKTLHGRRPAIFVPRLTQGHLVAAA